MRRFLILLGAAALASVEPATAQLWMPVRAPERTAPQSLARPPEPAAIRREKSGTAFFVDDSGHMLTARHAADDCARIIVAKEGRFVPARVVALSPNFDLALIKVPKTLGLAAVFPRNTTATVNDMVFAAHAAGHDDSWRRRRKRDGGFGPGRQRGRLSRA